MGSCVCFKKLQDLFRNLLPVVGLKVNIPLVVPKLAELEQVMQPQYPVPSYTRAYVDWALALPICPIHISLIASLRMNLQLMAQLQMALGISPQNPNSWSSFHATIQSLQFNFSPMFPMLQLTPPQLNLLLDLSSLMAQAANYRMNFGLDIFAPTFSVQLQLALSARMALPAIPIPPLAAELTPPVIANVQAWQSLADLYSNYGLNLLPTLNLMASLAFPPINLQLFQEMQAVQAVQQSWSQFDTFLGLNPLSVNLRLALPPLLEPLKFLETLELPPAPTQSMVWPQINTRADIDPILGMNFSPVLKLQIPNLAPLQLALKLMMENPVTSPTSCGSGCPMNISR